MRQGQRRAQRPGGGFDDQAQMEGGYDSFDPTAGTSPSVVVSTVKAPASTSREQRGRRSAPKKGDKAASGPAQEEDGETDEE